MTSSKSTASSRATSETLGWRFFLGSRRPPKMTKCERLPLLGAIRAEAFHVQPVDEDSIAIVLCDVRGRPIAFTLLGMTQVEPLMERIAISVAEAWPHTIKEVD